MSRPNVLLITCHDLGRTLGCYGHGYVRSPHLDRLAAEGCRLSSHFCTAPQCSPSRASLATGRYPHANGCMGLAHGIFGWSLHETERHLARRLAEAGYHTALLGGQHVVPGDRLDWLGFAERLGGGHGADLAAQAETWLAARPGGEPFYLELNFTEPHRPWFRGEAEPLAPEAVEVPGWMLDIPEAREELAEQEASIHYVDQAIGRVLAALDAAGLRDDTLVVFQADHGTAMPRAKCCLTDAGLGTAALVRWPAGGVGGGRVHDALLSNLDLVPTVLEAVGLPAPESVQGRSYLPLLQERSYTPREAVFGEKTAHADYDPMRGVRTRDWSYVRNFETGLAVDVPGDAQTRYYAAWIVALGLVLRPATELYDLRADPHEQTNLSGRPEAAAVEAELDRRLWAELEATADPLLEGPVPSPFYLRQIAARPGSGTG